MRNFAAGVLIASGISPLFAQNHPAHEAELQARLLVSKVTESTRNEQFQRGAQYRQFEVKFNQLVQAVAGFAKEYNKNQGAVWPRAKAEKLRKAFRDLEAVEKSLR